MWFTAVTCYSSAEPATEPQVSPHVCFLQTLLWAAWRPQGHLQLILSPPRTAEPQQGACCHFPPAAASSSSQAPGMQTEPAQPLQRSTGWSATSSFFSKIALSWKCCRANPARPRCPPPCARRGGGARPTCQKYSTSPETEQSGPHNPYPNPASVYPERAACPPCLIRSLSGEGWWQHCSFIYFKCGI